MALSAGAAWLRWLDRRSALAVDHFVGISTCVAERIERIYGRRADVIFPPVAAKPLGGAASATGDFLLSLGRLVPYKRVDLALAAAERVGIPLIVAGDGPDRARLEGLAGRQTRFVGSVSEAEAGRLLSQCRAFVFCGEEDFGIAPVEANAHGRPVVGYGRAGLLDTMIPGVTAELFTEQSVEAVADAIHRALTRTWEPAAMRQNAERFGPEHFRRKFEAVVVATLSGN
ncbi:MAG TPA: glycosyltransferase [Gemmatimonadales bacterium]